MYQKITRHIIFTLTLSIFFSSFSYAKTYRWDDFTLPFTKEFALHEGQNVTIEIHFPAFILENFKKIPLFIEHSTIVSSNSYPSLQINNSIWATYNLTDAKFLDIKIKHLQLGLNKFKFFLSRDVSERDNSVDATIKHLRFDFKDIDSLRAQITDKNIVESKPEVSVNSKPRENTPIKKPKKDRQKNYELERLKDLNRSFDKATRKYLQNGLKSAGFYHGKVDGVFGHQTRRAISAYQKNKGKKPTGYLDQKTAEELVRLGKKSNKKVKKKPLAKAKLNKRPQVEKKKNVKEQMPALSDTRLPIKESIETDLSSKKSYKSENKETVVRESKTPEARKVKLADNRNDGIIRTPEELGARYQSLIDSFNLSINETFYNQMIASIESCDRTGYYVSGAFISHYLHLRFNYLASIAQTSSEAKRNTILAERFKNSRNRLIMHYNSSTKNKQALRDVLRQCETYYQQTQAKISSQQKLNLRKTH